MPTEPEKTSNCLIEREKKIHLFPNIMKLQISKTAYPYQTFLFFTARKALTAILSNTREKEICRRVEGEDAEARVGEKMN